MTIKKLGELFTRVCINEYPTRTVSGKRQYYKRSDLDQWCEEAYDKGEDFFYVEPVNPVNPYGKLRLCEPKYGYEFNGMLNENEFTEIFG